MSGGGEKVLLAAAIGYGAIGGAFLRAFAALGHRVLAVNNRDFFPLRLSRLGRARNRLFRRGAREAYNRAFFENALAFRPEILVVLKGTLIFPETLAALREKLRSAAFLNFNYDDFFSRSPGNVFPGLERVLPLYDAFFPSKSANVPELLSRGARAVHYLPIGYDPCLHHPVVPTLEERARFGTEVVFAGTFTPEREKYLRELNGVSLGIWGGHWDRRRVSRGLRGAVRNGILCDTDLSRLFGSGKIALNFFRPENRDTHNQRTFEIPAAGAFMLSERSSELGDFFREDREFAGFSSPGELAEKIRYYLQAGQERSRVAAAGLLRLRAGRHTITDRVREALSRIGQP